MTKHAIVPMRLHKVCLSLVLTMATSGAWAHSDAADAGKNPDKPASAREHAFGKPGDPNKIARTITVCMDDSMRFFPSHIKVRQGETIRFIVQNRGKVLHEMVMGTMADLKSHGASMQQHPGMAHGGDYMTHVAAGKQGNMIWQFTKPGEFQFACLLPGHFEAGMVGKLTVTKG